MHGHGVNGWCWEVNIKIQNILSSDMTSERVAFCCVTQLPLTKSMHLPRPIQIWTSHATQEQPLETDVFKRGVNLCKGLIYMEV